VGRLEGVVRGVEGLGVEGLEGGLEELASVLAFENEEKGVEQGLE